MWISISDFARERGIEPQAVSRWLNRHEEYQKFLVEKGKRKVFERDGELYKILETKYPHPKPTIIINGLDPDEERELRERLQKAQELIIAIQSELTDQKLLNAENEANMMLLEDKKEYLEKRMQEQEQEQQRKKEELSEKEQENRKLREEIERLRSRSLFDRIFNK